ncbi:F-box protein, partial [Endozoicomonas sp. SESOKO3]|uniref:F-box protein n=1 Tax=Endozoicomonas sp. SESOKO3 TaxID=2828744 RepID=UPI002147CBF9
MHFTNRNFDAPLPPAPKIPRLLEAPTVVSLGREVSVQEKVEPTFFHLAEETHVKIIRYLDFRSIHCLTKVCTYLRYLVKKNRALERAWYRRFPSTHQYQLKTIFTSKDDQQLRDWLSPFANSGTVESFVKKRDNAYFPALILFTKSKLMSQCETLSLETKTEITHLKGIYIATLSADSCHLVTVSLAKTEDQRMTAIGAQTG